MARALFPGFVAATVGIVLVTLAAYAWSAPSGVVTALFLLTIVVSVSIGVPRVLRLEPRRRSLG